MLSLKVILFCSILFLIFLIPNASALILISEFEQNPPGTDSGNEWVELYSDEETNLSGWKLINGDDDVFFLNGSINGFLLITFSSQWLDNSDEKVILSDNTNNTLDETPILDDSKNNDLSWNLCNDEWVFINSTPGDENKCEGGSGSGGNGNSTNSGNGGSEEKEKKDEKKNEQKILVIPIKKQEPVYSVSIIGKPTSMMFGEVKIVRAKFSSSTAHDLLFLLYSSPKRVVRDIDGSIITQNKIDASTSIKAKIHEGEEIEFSLPLNLAENCNKQYEDGEYDVFLRGFKFEDGWKSIGDLANFALEIEYNNELCEDDQGTSITGSTTYSSKSKTIKDFGLWILIALTILLVVVVWKKKLI